MSARNLVGANLLLLCKVAIARTKEIVPVLRENVLALRVPRTLPRKQASAVAAPLALVPLANALVQNAQTTKARKRQQTKRSGNAVAVHPVLVRRENVPVQIALTPNPQGKKRLLLRHANVEKNVHAPPDNALVPIVPPRRRKRLAGFHRYEKRAGIKAVLKGVLALLVNAHAPTVRTRTKRRGAAAASHVHAHLENVNVRTAPRKPNLPKPALAVTNVLVLLDSADARIVQERLHPD
ncbi:hypothetical protein M231_07343 [Tremella mesenterica]|uniref:Secreted protein n=1 Tax=Tremella mesenterica TaxID=5217 RepID=A0A4Q1B9E1_TREME|nr:hypothetical protein M231_07343 [Tremella mesenterica]